MNTIQTFIPLQVFDLLDRSSTDDPAKNYLASQLNYKPAPSWSDTSDHNMLRYDKASRNVHNYFNAVYVDDHASVQNECTYVIRFLRENAKNDTMIGTTSLNVIVSREGSVISPLRANLHAAPFGSSAGQYYGATEAVSTHLNVSANRVNEPPEYGIINRLFTAWSSCPISKMVSEDRAGNAYPRWFREGPDE